MFGHLNFNVPEGQIRNKLLFNDISIVYSDR